MSLNAGTKQTNGVFFHGDCAAVSDGFYKLAIPRFVQNIEIVFLCVAFKRKRNFTLAFVLVVIVKIGDHLDTLELNDELEDLIMEGFERAGVDGRVSLLIGDCKETLKTLRAGMNMYDIVYIDANKREYCEYYDLVFDMVRPGGLILADNVLWDGKVCQDPLPQDKQTMGIARFNDMVSADPRVESVILPLRDGLNVIRKR